MDPRASLLSTCMDPQHVTAIQRTSRLLPGPSACTLIVGGVIGSRLDPLSQCNLKTHTHRKNHCEEDCNARHMKPLQSVSSVTTPHMHRFNSTRHPRSMSTTITKWKPRHQIQINLQIKNQIQIYSRSTTQAQPTQPTAARISVHAVPTALRCLCHAACYRLAAWLPCPDASSCAAACPAPPPAAAPAAGTITGCCTAGC